MKAEIEALVMVKLENVGRGFASYLGGICVFFFFLLCSFPAPGMEGSQIALRQVSLEDRIECERALDEVYWRHMLWPKDNPQPKPDMKAVISDSSIRKKVMEYIARSTVLELEWKTAISGGQLQDEIERMARDTKDPVVLRELWAALGNDPYLIAECLARPLLVERYARELEDYDASDNYLTDFRWDWNSGNGYRYRLPDISVDAPLTSASLYDVSNSWRSMATKGAPSPRENHTAVWTGVEMIVWGGLTADSSTVKSGGRYYPSTNSWKKTRKKGAPSPRYLHTAVWTGSEMIIWGGEAAWSQKDPTKGGRYNPLTNSWSPVATDSAPDWRWGHMAVWTGSEMIIWGGRVNPDFAPNKTGGRYNPSTDSWQSTKKKGAPSPREDAIAVWTGKEMIVWGGLGEKDCQILSTGRRYNPSRDSWKGTEKSGAPSPRFDHTAVWTGSEMIVWGGSNGGCQLGNAWTLTTGARYNPAMNSWSSTSTTYVPSGRSGHTAVWTGTEMIVWGGGIGDSSGGRYNPSTDSWSGTMIPGAPAVHLGHTAVWTGKEMIIWGGNTGGLYTP